MAVDFDAIHRDYPLTKIVGKTVKLIKTGKEWKACCPFHSDRTPSFFVLSDNRTYHCFGCGAHGDVIDFVAQVQRLSTSDAIRSLTGGVAPKLDERDRQRRAHEAELREAEQRRRQQRATDEARERWAKALPVNGVGNRYLERKDVAPYGTRREGDNLLVPIWDDAGEIMSVQAIPPEAGGKKRFHSGAPVAGGTLTLGDASQGPIVVAEGFATGASIQMATGLLVVVGFSKGALRRTAEIVTRRHPGRPVMIAADTNGVEAARDAADAVNGRVIIPEMEGADGTDFNDQAGHFGLDDVARLFVEPITFDDKLVRATPFVWRDAALIPKREWLYGRHLLRRFVSVDVAAGGVGKSSLKVGEAIALASGRDIYDQGLPAGPCCVWLYNLEDPADEIERRLHATAERFRINPEGIGDRLYVDSGRDQPLVIATQGPDAAMIARPVVDALIAEMLERKVDVLIVDPFISSHAVSENDNNAIDLVAREWNFIAERTGAAINLVHHVRKQNGTEATADSARGASALIGKARSVLVYNRMSKEDATTLNVAEDDRRFLFRVDNDKANLAPPEAGTWYRMNNVDLANGDAVGVACAWTPPDAFEGVTARHLMQVQRGIAEGKWRENAQAKAWAGHVVGNVLDLDMADRRNTKRVSQLLSRWISEGVLEVVKGFDEKRMERDFIVVGRWVSE